MASKVGVEVPIAWMEPKLYHVASSANSCLERDEGHSVKRD